MIIKTPAFVVRFFFDFFFFFTSSGRRWPAEPWFSRQPVPARPRRWRLVRPVSSGALRAESATPSGCRLAAGRLVRPGSCRSNGRRRERTRRRSFQPNQPNTPRRPCFFCRPPLLVGTFPPNREISSVVKKVCVCPTSSIYFFLPSVVCASSDYASLCIPFIPAR